MMRIPYLAAASILTISSVFSAEKPLDLALCDIIYDGTTSNGVCQKKASQSNLYQLLFQEKNPYAVHLQTISKLGSQLSLIPENVANIEKSVLNIWLNTQQKSSHLDIKSIATNLVHQLTYPIYEYNTISKQYRYVDQHTVAKRISSTCHTENCPRSLKDSLNKTNGSGRALKNLITMNQHLMIIENIAKSCLKEGMLQNRMSEIKEDDSNRGLDNSVKSAKQMVSKKAERFEFELENVYSFLGTRKKYDFGCFVTDATKQKPSPLKQVNTSLLIIDGARKELLQMQDHPFFNSEKESIEWLKKTAVPAQKTLFHTNNSNFSTLDAAKKSLQASLDYVKIMKPWMQPLALNLLSKEIQKPGLSTGLSLLGQVSFYQNDPSKMDKLKQCSSLKIDDFVLKKSPPNSPEALLMAQYFNDLIGTSETPDFFNPTEQVLPIVKDKTPVLVGGRLLLYQNSDRVNDVAPSDKIRAVSSSSYEQIRSFREEKMSEISNKINQYNAQLNLFLAQKSANISILQSLFMNRYLQYQNTASSPNQCRNLMMTPIEILRHNSLRRLMDPEWKKKIKSTDSLQNLTKEMLVMLAEQRAMDDKIRQQREIMLVLQNSNMTIRQDSFYSDAIDKRQSLQGSLDAYVLGYDPSQDITNDKVMKTKKQKTKQVKATQKTETDSSNISQTQTTSGINKTNQYSSQKK